MKMAFVVYNDYVNPQMMDMLKRLNIDYYTHWQHVLGKGRGTEPHIGMGTYASTNAVLMIAFEDEAPLAALIAAITAANKVARRADECIRLFQLPLERLV